jgi:lanthanide-dependent methanol dehydrogenase
MPVDGQTRKVLIRPDRNGYLYVIDRATGEVLSADAYGPVNSTKGIDLKTGRPILNPEKETKLGQTVRDICPTASGTKDWEPSAFSPRTGLIYVPHANLCMDWENIQVNYISGTPYVGANVRMKAGPGGNRGALTAWDPVKRKAVWEEKEDLPVWSGALVTAGDLVFYGTMEGWFKAVDPRAASSNGSSKPVPGLSDSQSPIAALTGANISRSCPGSAAGPVPSWPAISARRTRPRHSALLAPFPI